MGKNFLILVVCLWHSALLIEAAYGVVPMGPANLGLTSAESQKARGRLDRYLNFSDEEIKRRCFLNSGTALDQKLAAAYRSTCRASYEGARDEARKYFEAEKKAEGQLNGLSNQNATVCWTNRSVSGQKVCLEKVAEAYEEVARIKDQLSSDLLGAYNKAGQWRTQNAEALRQYKRDKRNLEVAYDKASKQVTELMMQGDVGAANKVVQELETASKISTAEGVVDSTVAQTVTHSTISGYKQNIDSLLKEQADAESTASQFSEDAKKKAYALKEDSLKFSDMAKEVRARIAALPTADTSTSTDKTGVSGAKMPNGENVPIPEPRPPQSEIDAAMAKQSPKNKITDTSSTQPTGTQEPAMAEINPTAGSRNEAPESGIANAPPAQAPAPAPGPAPMAAAPAPPPPATGGVSPGGDPYSYGGMPMPNSSKESEGNSGQLSALPVAKLGEEQSETAAVEEEFPEGEAESDEARFADIPKDVAAGDGISGDIKSSSAASTSAGVRGENGKLGFSSATGGRLGAAERAQKEIAAKEQFSPKLDTGAVSIAGSDVKSAVAALAEEFGAVDLNLDLGELTTEEKAALAPLEGGMTGSGGGRAASAVGRRTASVSNEIDNSIQDVESLGLFVRAHSAHERAQKRGNLILGLKKKY